jgi:hypothetical protein
MHRPRHDGACGSDQAQLSRSQLKSSNGTALLEAMTWRCTVLTVAVYRPHCGGVHSLLQLLGRGQWALP